MGQKEETFAEIDAATPFLRRYARALCVGAGAAIANDLVQSAVERICNDIRVRGGRATEKHGARIPLYRALTELAREALGADMAGRVSPRQPAIAHALAELPFEERAAILLVAVEGFGYAQTGAIVGADRDAILSRIRRARAAFGALDLRPEAPHDGARRAGGHLRIVK
jgi:RNA polymerase sigma-70 factor (ECF subfamily)